MFITHERNDTEKNYIYNRHTPVHCAKKYEKTQGKLLFDNSVFFNEGLHHQTVKKITCQVEKL